MMKIVVGMVAVLLSMNATAQMKGDGVRMMKSNNRTVCPGTGKNEFTTIPPPREYFNRNKARTKTSSIEVEYIGFTSEAQAAFQEAVDIWESIIVSPVTIHVRAEWTVLEAGVLGSASPDTYVMNFDGAEKKNVWYPVALAEKIAGKDFNPGDPDIDAFFNSANDAWNFGLVGEDPGANQYDLVSIVLHEIGHGLGITHAYTVSGGQGRISDGFGVPVAYETNIESAGGLNLVNDFVPPSVDLKNVITGVEGYFVSQLVRDANNGGDARIFLPATYQPGSSIAHLDEASYPAKDINSLMTPGIGMAERILDPGPIVRAILKEIGWEGTLIKHTRLKNTENVTGPYSVVATIDSDKGYDATSVKVNYKTTGSVFLTIPMTATGNANEFTVNLPTGASNYTYFISVKENTQKIYTTPGKIIKAGSEPVQDVIVFEAGPDTKGPFINHTPKEFITTNDKFQVDAIVSDNIGVAEVKMEWKYNGDVQPEVTLNPVADTDSTYRVIIDFNGDLATGDIIEYRLRAKDNSVAGNTSFKPGPTTFYSLNVTGLEATQNSYFNDFNNLSAADFFGNGFSVAKPAGFIDGAIHSEHPYQGAGVETGSLDFIYNLKVPVRLKDFDATIKFDEIVLVEPGESGVAWPGTNFYDYVVVEGSVDGGITWVSIADGYDARQNPTWSTLWSGSISENNSTAVGTPALYRSHTFNLLDKFAAGDEVAFRFRLFSDPLSVGWGWSIDNLKIQIDDTPPQILHQHYDYLMTGTTVLNVDAKITDLYGLNQIFFDYNVNDGATSTVEILVNPLTDDYSSHIDLSDLGLKAGDELRYKIRATDKNANTGAFPTTGFIKTAILSMTPSVAQIEADFTSGSADFSGNFFGVQQPSGFTSAGMNSNHPYDLGMGPNGVSEFSWITKKSVKVSATNPLIYYDDVALIEFTGTSVKDYVVIEGSKDGITWDPISVAYAAQVFGNWKILFQSKGNPTVTVLHNHTIDITSTGKFKAGDEILIRFRLHSDAETTGWGWYVDNLSIQGFVTGLEKEASSAVVAWPNPVTGGSLHVKLDLPAASEVDVQILSLHGQLLSSERFSAPAGNSEKEYQVAEWPEGFYLLRVNSDFGTSTQKVIKHK